MGIAFNPFTGNFDFTGSGVPGDITAVAAGTGLTGGGTTGDVTLSLANTAVTAGSYTYANITVDAQGRITSASSGSTPSAIPGGSDTQIQFNDGGSFGGDADLTYNKTSNKLTTKGDVELNDGGTYTTTVQCVTPTANRTISFPDATGTVGLVAGSSGQVVYNNAGAYGGVSTMTFDGTSVTLAGRLINSYTSVASSPAKVFTGTWFTGGTATTTKPHFLIEPSGATSTAWSTSGTGLGVNAASGFTGNLLDLQVNGTSRASISATGDLRTPSGGLIVGGVNSAYTYQSSSLLLQPAGQSKVLIGTGSFNISDLTLNWTSNTTAQSIDLTLARDAANTLAQRNGTNAQTFRVYNSYTSGTNYELGKLEWSSNVFRIGTEKGSGGGTARTLEIQTDGTTRLTIGTTGGLTANTSSGFTGNLLDLQVNGSSKFRVTETGAFVGSPVEIGIACSDETTALTTGTAKATFRLPYAMTLTAVRASVGTAPTGSKLIIDINEGGTSVLSTKLSIDISEKRSTLAAIPAVISDSALADDAEITIDIDQIGSTVAGAGLKVWLIGTRA